MLLYKFFKILRSRILILPILTFTCIANASKNTPLQLNSFISSSEISNQQINCFAQDNKGYIWIGTNRGLNKYDGYEFVQYFKNSDRINTLCNNSIQYLLKDNQNKLWIGTKEGICIYEEETESFHEININVDHKSILQIIESQSGNIYCNLGNAIYKYNKEGDEFIKTLEFSENNTQNRFFIDKSNQIWLISRQAIKCYNEQNNKELQVFYPNRIPNLVYGYYLNDGSLWTIHGIGGISLFNTILRKEIPVPDVIKQHPILSHALLTNIFDYSPSQLLINTHKNGLFLFDKEKNKIIDQNALDFPFETSKSNITSLFKDKNENLWIGSHEKGVNIQYKYKNQFNHNRSLQTLTRKNSIKTIDVDNKQNVWFSTYDDELYIYSLPKQKIIQKVDLTSFFEEDPYFQDKIRDLTIYGDTIWFITDGKIHHCSFKQNKLVRNKSYSIVEELFQQTIDKDRNFWVCTQTGNVYLIKNRTEELIQIPVFKYGGIYDCAILALSNGNILVSASNEPFKLIHPDKLQITSINPDIKLSDFEPSTLYEDSNNNIWVGQLNGPLLKLPLDLSSVEMLEVQNATSIIEDNRHEMWIGTSYGLSHYIQRLNKYYTYYGYDGIAGNQFNIKCVAILPDNSLAFGGTNGLTIFKPTSISSNRKIDLFIEALKINNQYYYKTNFIKDNQYREIELDHNENNFNIEYTALDISEYSRLRYYYKLDGYNTDWVDAKNNRIANYANLKPGEYTFRVKVTSNDDSSTESENSLTIIINRPPWFSNWAIAIYIVIIAYILWLILNLYSRLKMNKAKALMAIREKEHEAYINNMNMSFFSNISHEFRTPLTIISAPIITLYKSLHVNQEERKLLELIQRSIKRMLRLVNQLMDLSKLEADTLKLKVSRIDVVHQIKSIVELYVIYGHEKDIKVTFNRIKDSFFMLIDIDKLEKILGNILSNALKFTHQHGNIEINMKIIDSNEAIKLFPAAHNNKYRGGFTLFEIKDDGTGIPDDKLDDIFLRYYQIDNKQNASYNWGSGIGLYYSQKLVELHHGFIKAENNEFGGASFLFIIPIEDKAYSEDEISETTEPETGHYKIHEEKIPLKSKTVQSDIPDNSKDTVLVVDDDIEVSYYLKTLLSHEYNVVNKYDGEDAFNSLEEINPTLIISDVLMPGINGYELCQKIKDNVAYCHIPVVLLTAKSQMEEKIEGLETGANAYITKPFDPNYLEVVVKSQIKNQKLISNLLTNNTNTKTAGKDILLPKDKALIDSLYELLEKELDNPEMNISVIAEKLGMSRTKFYYKIKSLTNETPNTFFKKYKLNRAAELIKSGEYNISEIANMTGFMHLPHFSVSFKKQFGCNPSEYKG